MGICLSNQIKAESRSHTSTGASSSKMITGDGTELSNSGSSKRSSASIPPTPRSEGEIWQSSNMKSFAFSDLKAAMRKFYPDSVLGGGGGFGSIFKGWVDEHSLAASKPGSSMVVAVKRLNQDVRLVGPQGMAGRHPNLVKLIGYCLEDDHILLVYEFMPKGSMENHLFRSEFSIT